MADREKVIRGLGCIAGEYDMESNKCAGCGYQECATYAICIAEIARDAIELLKAQEPRVMPADEIVLSAEPSKWLWVERKGEYCAEAFKAGKTISGLIAFDSETPGAFLYCEHPNEYGKTWRCWTARPTDEQREAVKWDE